MENLVENGWTITSDANGYSATYWRDSYGLVSVWHADWHGLLERVGRYDFHGNLIPGG